MGLKFIARYLGKRDDEFQIRGMTGRTYRISAPGILLEVDLDDWPAFPKQFFEQVSVPDPVKVKEGGKPPKNVLINTADGIDDKEATEAAGVLAQYRAERLGKKLDELLMTESQEWEDYYEIVKEKSD